MAELSIAHVARTVGSTTGRFSVRWLVGLLNMPDLSVTRRLQLLNAIQQYAPELRLHPNDIYRPTSVPLYLQNTRMRRHRRWWPDVHILDPFEVNVRTLISQSSGGQYSGLGSGRTNFFVEIAINVDETRRGRLAVARCYVHLRRAPASGEGWDIQYWFFYAYNGDITFGADFEHEGDWEHLTVRLDPQVQAIQEVFFHVHNTESQWRQPGEFQVTGRTHPIAYSARHTHATYWNAGKQHRRFLPDDHTSDDGPAWPTWQAISLIGERDRPVLGNDWVRYTGKWGQIGTIFSWLSGPHSPSFQGYWSDDDNGYDLP
jgi:Vacuolar protein sorting-associated protein 62